MPDPNLGPDDQGGLLPEAPPSVPDPSLSPGDQGGLIPNTPPVPSVPEPSFPSTPAEPGADDAPSGGSAPSASAPIEITVDRARPIQAARPAPRRGAPPPENAPQDVPEEPAAPVEALRPKPSELRRPRPVVRIDGVLADVLGFRVEAKSHFTSDTFELDLDPLQQPQGFDWNYWADAQNVDVSISAGFLTDDQAVGAAPADDPDAGVLIIGQVDDVEIDAATGKLKVTGRDFSARLIDELTTDFFPDHTSSQIAIKAATDAGLTPQVTETTIPVRHYYRDRYAAHTRAQPIYDLLVFLAEQEGFDFYVHGTMLYFGPPQAEADDEPWNITAVADDQGRLYCNVKSLSLRRSLTLAKDMTVTVDSVQLAHGRAITATASRAGVFRARGSRSRGAGKTQNYIVHRPNLTQQGAQQLANSLLAKLSQNERTFQAVVEADLDVTPRRRAEIGGVANSFACRHYITEVHTVFDSASAGFEMTVMGKNTPTVAQADGF